MTEPDYRFSLAAERTYLAYVRSALALLGGSVATTGYLEATNRSAFAYVASFALFGLGLVTLIGGHLRFRMVMAAIRADRPLPTNPMPTVLTILIVVVAALGIIAVRVH